MQIAKESQRNSSPQRQEVSSLTQILLWRTASLLKIAIHIYKDKISEIDRSARNSARRMSLSDSEFSDYVANLVKARTQVNQRISEYSHHNHDLELHDQQQTQLYDRMLTELKLEHPHLKLSKFIAQVDERSQLKEVLAAKKKGRNINHSGPARYQTIRRRNAQLGPEIRSLAKIPIKEYQMVSTFKKTQLEATSPKRNGLALSHGSRQNLYSSSSPLQPSPRTYMSSSSSSRSFHSRDDSLSPLETTVAGTPSIRVEDQSKPAIFNDAVKYCSFRTTLPSVKNLRRNHHIQQKLRNCQINQTILKKPTSIVSLVKKQGIKKEKEEQPSQPFMQKRITGRRRYKDSSPYSRANSALPSKNC